MTKCTDRRWKFACDLVAVQVEHLQVAKPCKSVRNRYKLVPTQIENLVIIRNLRAEESYIRED